MCAGGVLYEAVHGSYALHNHSGLHGAQYEHHLFYQCFAVEYRNNSNRVRC